MGEEEDQKKKNKEPKAADQTTTEKEDQDNIKPSAAENQDEKKKGGDESKKPDESPPDPPPQIVLKVYMHCQGCARKVRRCLQGCTGVEDVMTDCKSGKVVVKGEKADPLELLDRLEKKTHRKVELLSPIPKPPAEEDNKTTEDQPEQQPAAKPDDNNEQQAQPRVIIVVLKVYMHCEACAMEMKKRILKMKGVESAEPDLKSSQVSVKGVFEADKLVEYILKRTGKHAAILKQEPEKKEQEQNKEEKKTEEPGGDDKDKKEGGAGEEASKAKEREGGDGDTKAPAPKPEGGGTGTEEISKVVNEVMKRNEYYYQNLYPQRFNAMEMHSYPPQIFSDENPNACCVM